MRRNKFFAGERSRDQHDTDTRFSGGRGRADRRSAIAGVEVGQPRSGRAVGGASMGESERAEIRRNCDGLRVTESRSGGAGGDRAAQEAFCGALVSVALVQPSDAAKRTDRGEMTRLREERRTARGSRRRSEGTRRTEAGAGERPLISSYISGREYAPLFLFSTIYAIHLCKEKPLENGSFRGVMPNSLGR